ncbi:MAG TPA: CPBP family intramembrane metalloprotease [Lachnospiraceae bacterium]|nr:CPBP family intramembrane metalloprotease [Lachnospiraceae bacterium]
MKKSFGILICILPYFAMLLIRMTGAAVFGRIFETGLGMDYNTYVVYVLALIAVIYIIVFGVWYYFGFARKNQGEGQDSFWTIRTMLLLLLLGAAVQIAVSYILFFLLSLSPSLSDEYMSMLSPLLSLSPAAVLYAGILSPVGEECIFRGVILGYAKENTRFYLANFLQAALFGVFHGNLVQGIYAFLLGLLLGYLVKLSGSVFGGIIFHSALNFAGLYLERLLPEELPVYLKVFFMLAAAAVCALILFVLSRHGKNKNRA